MTEARILPQRCGRRGSQKQPKLCLCGCGGTVNTRHTPHALFASSQCVRDHEYWAYIRAWRAGEVTGNIKGFGIPSNHVRRFILERDGHRCVLCGWGQKNPFTNRWPLVLDHIDGNSDRTTEDNLRTLCPNCDSLTATYKNANRGNGRLHRRKVYAFVTVEVKPG